MNTDCIPLFFNQLVLYYENVVSLINLTYNFGNTKHLDSVVFIKIIFFCYLYDTILAYIF